VGECSERLHCERLVLPEALVRSGGDDPGSPSAARRDDLALGIEDPLRAVPSGVELGVARVAVGLEAHALAHDLLGHQLDRLASGSVDALGHLGVDVGSVPPGPLVLEPGDDLTSQLRVVGSESPTGRRVRRDGADATADGRLLVDRKLSASDGVEVGHATGLREP
jgi:hypothetical protein